jgi:hypothetical protein
VPRIHLTRLVTALALCGPVVPAHAQLVRGIVTDRASGDPIPGVVITLAAVPSGATLDVLSNPQGEFAARLGAPGRYVLVAKRIGAGRYTSPSFAIGEGETRRMDVVLDLAPRSLGEPLPRVIVSALEVCPGRSTEADRVAELWEEIRTALQAVQVSVRDSLVGGRMSLFVRALHPRNLRVLSESRVALRPISAQPFASLTGDSLSTIGYWRELPGDSLALYGPDASVLVSRAFLRDHCYRIAPPQRDRRGLVGLAFEPVATRRLPDVAGTMWVDSLTRALRFVEFRYVRIPREIDVPRVGGEVHFARLPSGAWVVNNWFIRMPQFALDGSGRFGSRLFDQDGRRVVLRLREGGGELTGNAVPTSFSTAILKGRALDTLRAALAGATVQLTGTWHRTSADLEGRFRFGQLYPGTYEVAARTPGYSELGVNASEEEITVGRGDSVNVELHAVGRDAIRARHCQGRESLPGSATLRVVARDTLALPVPGIAVHLSWTRYDQRAWDARLLYQGLPMTLRGVTDESGAVVFCAIPQYSALYVTLQRAGADPLLRELVMARGEVSAMSVEVRQR